MKRLVPAQGKDWNERLQGTGEVGISLDQWVRIAQALGRPQDYLDLVALEVAEAKTGELPPLPAKAFQHDCKTYQDTLDHLLAWHVVAYRLGYEPEYLQAITTVAISLNQAKNPTPVSAAFKEQMYADIAQWQKVSAERQAIAQAALQLVKQFGTPHLQGTIYNGKTLQIISDDSSVMVSARRDGREILKMQGDEVVKFKPNAEELHKLRQLVKIVPKLLQQLHQIQRQQQSRGLRL